MANLLTKRVARRALAIAAVGGLIGTLGVTPGAEAQTTPSITGTVVVNGPVPAGITSGQITATCRDLVGLSPGASYTVAVTFTLANSSNSVSVPGLNPAGTTGAPNPLGSSCLFSVTVNGTANADKGAIVLNVGGTDRGATTPFTNAAGVAVPAFAPKTTTTGNFATNSTYPLASSLAVPGSTVVTATITYPSIIVRKVVNGDEPVPSFAYPMTIACSGTAPAVAFLVGLNGYVIPTDYTKITVADLPNVVVSIPNNGFVTGATGVQYYNGGTFPPTAAGLASLQDFVLSASKATTPVTIPANPGTTAFTGAFTLAGGATRTFGLNDFPGLTPSSTCEVRETNSQGAALAFSSTNGFNADGTPRTPLVGVPDATYGLRSALTTTNGQTITVTNSFTGDLIVSKVVTGDPKTNVGSYEISVSCDKNGPRETFLLRDRQSKTFTGINAGTNCLVTETKSDGATATYSDNSGDNATDGRVSIRLASSTGTGCGSGFPPNPSGPRNQASDLNNCAASVIVTNSYVTTTTNAPSTTAAPTTAAPTTAAVAPPTTAAPPATAAPATPVDEEPEVTG